MESLAATDLLNDFQPFRKRTIPAVIDFVDEANPEDRIPRPFAKSAETF